MTSDLEMELSSVGARHPGDFAIDRPKGNGYFVFVHFGTAITVKDVNGVGRHERNSAILYSPSTPTWYSGVDHEWENTWFHCGGAVGDRADRYGIPTNLVMPIGPLDFLAPFLTAVLHENLRREVFWEETIALLADDFFCRLGRRAAQMHDKTLTPYQREQIETMRNLRAAVHGDLRRQWRVEDMASLAHLSPSRFTSIYRSFFGMAPMDDLIESRLSHAGKLLQQSSLSINVISEMCGFNNVTHFSRFFHLRRGVSPRDWRSAGSKKAGFNEADVRDIGPQDVGKQAGHLLGQVHFATEGSMYGDD